MINDLIAKEGHKTIFYSFLIFLIFSILDFEFFSFIFFILSLWSIYIYRNKKLKKDYTNSDILSPISGVVSSIDSSNNGKKVFIDVSLCDNHILRAPKNGNFVIEYKRGVHTLLDSLKAKKLNEKALIKYSDIKMELISSLYNNDISISTNEALMGDKIGVFLNGQIIVELDNSKELLVNIGTKVESGKTVIARVK